MIRKGKLIVVLGAFVFSLGIVSMGFGYWTDQLNLEGNANLNLNIKVTDDIIDVEYTTSDAVEIIDDQMPDPASVLPALPDESGDSSTNHSEDTSTTTDSSSSGDSIIPAESNKDDSNNSVDQTGNMNHASPDSENTAQDNSNGTDGSDESADSANSISQDESAGTQE